MPNNQIAKKKVSASVLNRILHFRSITKTYSRQFTALKTFLFISRFCLMTFRRVEPYINFRFTFNKRICIRIIERPGLWMSPSETQVMLDELRRVARKAIGNDLDYGVLKGSQSALNSAILTILYDAQTGMPIAFNALTAMDCMLGKESIEVIHLGLAIIDQSSKCSGFLRSFMVLTVFLLFLKKGANNFWITNVTQVPAILGVIGETFSFVYPSPDHSMRRSFRHLALARKVTQCYRSAFGVGKEAVFDEDRFIIKNSYTGGSDNLKKSFEETTKYRNPIYNEFCQKQLNYGRGDDFLQIGCTDLRLFWKCLLLSVPKGSLLSVVGRSIAGQYFYITIEKLIIPFIQWLSFNQPMGRLRPSRGLANAKA